MKGEELFRMFDYLDDDLIEESVNYGGNTMKKGKIQNLYKTLAAVAAALAVFIAIPNISGTAAYAMEQVPVLGSIVRLVTFRDYSREDDHQNIDLEIPEIASDSHPETVESVNEDINRIADNFIAEYEAAIKEENPDLSISMNYEVLCSSEKYFTLKLNCFQAVGGGHEWNEFYTIDLETGERLELSSLFKEGADYVSVISSDIISQMRELMAADENNIFFLDQINESDNFTEISEDQNFYINADGRLVIAFDEYEVAPGYMGTVEFIISDEAVAPILK